MTYNDKEYIVHCPTEEDSRAVQERMFEMGGWWNTCGSVYNDASVRTYAEDSTLRICDNGIVFYADKPFYTNSGYEVISTQEFLSQTAHYSKKEQKVSTQPTMNKQVPEKFFVRTPTQEMFDEVNKMMVEYFGKGTECHPFFWEGWREHCAVSWVVSSIEYCYVEWYKTNGWTEVDYTTLKQAWQEKCCSAVEEKAEEIVGVPVRQFVSKEDWEEERVSYLVNYVKDPDRDLFDKDGVAALEELVGMIRKRI